MRQLEKKYKVNLEELSEIYTRVSGRMDMVVAKLENKKVNEWSYLEDLALEKAPGSEEYEVLLE